jgi:hypothetical protein
MFHRARALLLATPLLAACGGAPEPQAPAAPSAISSAVAEPAAAPLPPGSVRRADMDRALMRGPGWLLSRVQTEEVIRQNKFVGWRLVAFPAEWDGSGLQPGDVVTDVNGTVLEKPDDLWSTWLAASEAGEVRIAFERDGKPSAAVLTILGAPNPETRKNLEAGAMIAPAETAEPSRGNTKDKKRFETKVIGGDASEPSDVSEF